MITLERIKPGPKPGRLDSRNSTIYRLWVRKHEVMSLAEIADLYALTRGRIWQIVNAGRLRDAQGKDSDGAD